MKWTSPVQMRASVSSLRRGLIVLGLILLGTTSGVQAQPTSLDDAIRTYNEARYDEAIEQFTAIAFLSYCFSHKKAIVCTSL